MSVQNTARVRDLLFRDINPYESFVARLVDADLQGWNSDHPVLPHLIRQLRPARIIEVGTWKGRSAIKMALASKAIGLNTEIICVDTFLGSAEHWLASGEHLMLYESLKLKNGRPNLYETFLSNVVLSGCADVVTPFPIDSQSAFYWFVANSIKADLIYVDAGHEYDSVLADLRRFWTLLGDKGCLVVDDFLGWDGVTKAVMQFCNEVSVFPISELSKAVITRNPNVGLRNRIVQQ
jgi:hypothetical protein